MNPIDRRTLLLRTGVAGLASFAGSQARAQAGGYPNRPVRIIVATVPGSGPDIAVRKMTGTMAELLKQPVVVENRPGANGMLAASEVARAPHDGYTLLDANIGNALNDLLRPQPGTRMVDDLVPVTDLTAGPLILLVHPSVPARTVRELIDHARANPKALSYGSGGPGSLIQLTGERVKRAGGFEMVEVPYKSLGADITDLLAGNIQVAFTVWTIAAAHVRAGKMRALAVASGKRISTAPEVPTFDEAGLAGITATGWNGIFAPAGTPDDVVQVLNKAIATALAQPEYQQFFLRDGNEIGGKSTAEFTAFIKAEKARYAQIIQAANIKLD